jgi:hypothetical protein
MERKKIRRLYKYFATIARREGIEQMAVGIFVISDDKLLVIREDGGYGIPKASIGKRTLAEAINTLAREHGLKDPDIIMWIDKIPCVVDEKPTYLLNFAVSGEIEKRKDMVWASDIDLPEIVRRTMQRYWKKLPSPTLPK